MGLVGASFADNLPVRGLIICASLLIGTFGVDALNPESVESAPNVKKEVSCGDTDEKPDDNAERPRSFLQKWNSRASEKIGSVMGDLITIVLFLLLLTFSWEYMKKQLMGHPTITFAPTTHAYNINVQTTRTPPLSVPPDELLKVAVFFENRSSELRSDQRVDLAGLGEAALACPGSTFVVAGFASSRPFHNDPDSQKNESLAKARAQAAVSAIREKVGPDFPISDQTKNTYVDMHRAAGVRDLFPPKNEQKALEFLNRRVVITLNLPPACIEPQTP